MKASNPFITGLVIPLLVAFLTPLAVSASSQIQTGNALQFLNQVPYWVWLAFGAGIAVWVIIGLVRIRNKKKQHFGALLLPEHGSRYGTYPHEDVLWVVCSTAPSDVKRSRITVLYTPLCPNCKTELEEAENFWCLYDWSCPRDDFKKRNKPSFSIASDRAERLAKSDIINRM